MMNTVIIIRNLRGAWARRLVIEIAMREIETNKVVLFDAQNYEFFPPNLKYWVFPSAAVREKFFSRIRYRNPGFTIGSNEIISRGGVVKQMRGIYSSFRVFKTAITFMRISSREVVKSLEVDKCLIGQALDGLFVGMSGSTLYHPREIPFFKRFKAILIFLGSFYKFNSLFAEHRVDRLYLVNGRDALGSGCLASCIVNHVRFFTLEKGHLNSSGTIPIPSLGLWPGNMHKWRNKKLLLNLKIQEYNIEKVREISEKTFDSKFGFKSKYWDLQEKIEAIPGSNIPKQPFICFFSTSEVEFSGIQDETGIVEESEQITQFNLLRIVAEKLEVPLILRLHPNSNSEAHKFEKLKWCEIIQNDNNVFLVSGSTQLDSYQLGSLSLNNFFYRSSLAAEFLRKGLPVSLLAETFWSTSEHGLVCKSLELIEDAIRNPKINFKDDSWVNFGFYYGCSGEDFRHFNFTSSNGKLTEHFKGLAIDVPRRKNHRLRRG
jgi:hypothetical protein